MEYKDASKNSRCKEVLVYEMNSVHKNDQTEKKKKKRNIT